MKNIILILVLLISLSGCAEQIEESDEEQQIINPASVYCEEQGNRLDIRTATDGSQTGYCILQDGTECEEWAYYRNECPEEELQTEPEVIEEKDIFCPDYDGNEEECLLHEECKWDSKMSECDSINMTKTDDEEVDEEEDSEFASDLEKGLPDTIQNQICKKLPLTRDLSPSDRYRCLAVVNNNPKFCELIKADNENDIDAQNEKNVCLAQANKDVSYCKKVTTDLGKRTCYFGLSGISGDINVCDGITYDKNLRELCYWSFANALYWESKSDKITTEHCNKLPAGSESRDSCLAQKEGDVSLCKGKANCLTLFEQPMSFCTTGKGKALEYCIRDRAMSSKNFSICETLTGEKRDDCIGDFAGHITQDTLTCNKISDIKARNTCYMDVAIQSSSNFWFNLYN